MRTLLLSSLALGTLGALTGCVTPLNDDPALSDGTPLHSATTAPVPGAARLDAPSLTTGLDRSGWPQTVYSVPQRDTVHQPIVRSRPVRLARSSAVQRGEYPTEETAGENVTGNSRGAQTLEAVLAPLQTVGDFFLFIPRSFVTPPRTAVRGPLVPVDRVTPLAPTAPAGPAASPPPPPADAPAPINPIPDSPRPVPDPAQGEPRR
jgi:hypothetical protein